MVRTKEGVEYVLRFGRVASVDTESEEGKLNRFLLVSTRVNQQQFPEPELEPLPELPAAAPPEEGACASRRRKHLPGDTRHHADVADSAAG